MTKVLITPETRLSELMEAYPECEAELLAAVPPLAKLKTPALRTAVARATTLDQAAPMGGLSVVELVRRLRQAAGLPEPGAGEAAGAGSAPPPWVSQDRVRFEIDADEMLKRGEHPVGPIRQWAATLEAGQIIRLTSSFRPVPLLEAMARSGMMVYSSESSPGRHVSWFARPAQ